jgi:hypothetical protein
MLAALWLSVFAFMISPPQRCSLLSQVKDAAWVTTKHTPEASPKAAVFVQPPEIASESCEVGNPRHPPRDPQADECPLPCTYKALIIQEPVERWCVDAEKAELPFVARGEGLLSLTSSDGLEFMIRIPEVAEDKVFQRSPSIGRPRASSYAFLAARVSGLDIPYFFPRRIYSSRNLSVSVEASLKSRGLIESQAGGL